MRPKIVLAILGFGVIALAGLFILRQQHGAATESPINAPPLIAASSDSQQANAAKSNVTRPLGVDMNASGRSATPAIATSTSNSAGVSPSRGDTGLTHEEYVEKRVGELMDLGMSDDPRALKTILSELANPEAEIRQAAIEATKQFGSTDAIPALQSAMTNGVSADDRQDLKDAIEFLKLPSFVAKKN